MTALAIEAVKVERRHRHDLGAIQVLAMSMTDLGQLQPIVVTPDNVLIAGQRRIAAARSLGWTEIDVHVARNLDDAASALRAERDENTCRKDFTQTEQAAVYLALLALEAPQANERAKAGKPLAQNAGGRAKDRAAEAVTGKPRSRDRLDKVVEVQSVADDATTPEPVRTVARESLAEMDRTGKVDGAHKRATTASKAAAAASEFPELDYYVTAGKFDAAVRLGTTLRGIPEPERTARRNNLRASIAAEQNRTSEPLPETPVDYVVLMGQMFEAVNLAARKITKCGGVETASQVAHLDPLMVDNWRGQFANLAASCAALAGALRPSLRSVK